MFGYNLRSRECKFSRDSAIFFFFRKSAVYLIHVRCVNHCHGKTNNLAIKLLEAVSTNQSPVQQIDNVARGLPSPQGGTQNRFIQGGVLLRGLTGLTFYIHLSYTLLRTFHLFKML